MTKLSDSQLVVLSAACQRDGRSVYPLTLKVKGNAAGKVLASLLAKGLIEEVPARLEDEVWREAKDGTRLTLRATDAAEAALGIETGAEASTDAGVVVESPKPKKGLAAPRSRPGAGARKARRKGRAPAKAKKAAKATRKKGDAKALRATRANSKQARLIEMLKRPKGASIAEIVEAFDWQPHTVRGAIAGALKKKLGLDVASEKIDVRGRVYKITTAA